MTLANGSGPPVPNTWPVHLARAPRWNVDIMLTSIAAGTRISEELLVHEQPAGSEEAWGQAPRTHAPAAARRATATQCRDASCVHGRLWVNDGGEGGVARALAVRWRQTKAFSGPSGSLV